jgi:hypothetical protein
MNNELSQSDLLDIVEYYYPRITERKASLALTGVNTRTFYHWKSQGLIDFDDSNSDKRTWVKLNIFDFVWLKILNTSREFGLSIPSLLELKKYTMLDVMEVVFNDFDTYKESRKELFGLTDEQVDEEFKLIEKVLLERKNCDEEEKLLYTYLGNIINSILINNVDASLIITKSNTLFDFTYVFYNQYVDIINEHTSIFEKPHLNIPIRQIIFEFLEEPRNEKYLDVWGFIRKDERKVLDALRNKDFVELIIKRKGQSEDFIIEATVEKDVMNEKAKEVRRILGMNEYQEVTVKLRNDKHLFIRNKMKL